EVIESKDNQTLRPAGLLVVVECNESLIM
ncbi:hypothetical protein A2U01_0117001, partial [Trifolium medium]|nr:hypothetical protein [Trifolium medium]